MIAARGFVRYRATEYEIAIDGAQQRRSALIVAIANASQYGNNARIAPLASLRDGLLDVVVIDRLSPLAIPSAGLRLFRGTLDRAKKDYQRGTEQAYAERDKTNSNVYADAYASAFLQAEPSTSIQGRIRQWNGSRRCPRFIRRSKAP